MRREAAARRPANDRVPRSNPRGICDQVIRKHGAAEVDNGKDQYDEYRGGDRKLQDERASLMLLCL
jgi:hypothetical protein